MSVYRRTPRLIPTSKSFDEYLAGISKSARYEYRKNARLTEGREYREVPFDPQEVGWWMELWKKQPIAGGFPTWAKWSPEKFRQLGTARCFSGGDAFHVVEVCDEYLYAHPPMYDKSHPEMARFMWFNLVRWACEGDVDWIDLGAPGRKSWGELVRRPDKSYKWQYVPREYRRDAPDWWVQICECGWRQLVTGDESCRRCGASR